MITDKSCKLMELFFTYPEKQFHIREIARLTSLSSTGVIKIVARLKKEDLLTSKKERMVELVSLAKNEKTLALKRINNLESLYRYGLVSYLRDFFEEPEAIILFGSYASGSDTSESDIDIAVISKSKKEPNLKKFEDNLKRKINPIVLQKITKKFKNALANGIVLDGYLRIENERTQK